METGFLRHARTLAGPGGVDLDQGYCPSTCPSTRERKRSRGPLPALRRRSPEALAGGRWLGGRIVERVSAEPDEAVVVEGDRPHVPGRLDRLRRLHLDVDCVVVLRFDLLRRVLDFLGEGREV